MQGMNGMTATFVLMSGQTRTDIDAGYCPIPDPCELILPTLLLSVLSRMVTTRSAL
ncbi:MAG: hypothetical protein R2795_05550 [Saprospiraceae bacterium]